MRKLSYKIAYCGISTALCLVAMFCTGIIPFSMYLMPVIASILLLFIKEELGAKWAWLSFIAVSILSLILTPDWEAKLIFIFTIGWYPLLRDAFIKIKPRLFSFIVRIAILNLTTAICYFVLIKVFGMTELLDTGGVTVTVFIISTILIAEFFFIIFDFLVAKFSFSYKNIISKRLRKRMK